MIETESGLKARLGVLLGLIEGSIDDILDDMDIGKKWDMDTAEDVGEDMRYSIERAIKTGLRELLQTKKTTG